MGKAGSAPTAQGSILYDIINDIVIDVRIKPLSVDERTIAKAHIDNSKDLMPDGKKLIIFDRSYPSFELIKKLKDDEYYYLMRVKIKFNKEIDAQTETDGYIWYERNGERLHIRVIKFLLDSGETEMLITNITDKRFGITAF